MIIQELNGKYHFITESLYRELSKHKIICENNELCLIKEALSGNEWIYTLLKNNHNIDLEDKRYKKIKDKVDNYINTELEKAQSQDDINQIVNTVANQLNNQSQQQTTQQPEQNNQSQHQDTNQNNINQDNTQQPEQNNQDDENVKTISDKPSEEIIQKSNDFINKNIKIYINQIRKYGMDKDVLDFINKSTQSKYNSLINVPAEILFNVVSNYKPLRQKLLTDRFKAALNNYNIPENMKKDILKYYEDEEKNHQDWDALFPKIMSQNKNQTIFDFPIAQYYIQKYNTNMAAKIYKVLGEYIHNELNPQGFLNHVLTKFGDTKNIAEYYGITADDTPEEISKHLENLFGADIVNMIMKRNSNILNDVSVYDKDIDKDKAEELLKLVMSNDMMQSAEISNIKNYVDRALKEAGLIPFIDYIITMRDSHVTKDVSGNPEQELLKINLFNDYSVSAIINKIQKYKEFNSEWEIGYQSKTNNAIYDSVYYVPVTNKETGLSGIITFVSGFALLNIIQKGYREGYQKGRNFKGFFNG